MTLILTNTRTGQRREYQALSEVPSWLDRATFRSMAENEVDSISIEGRHFELRETAEVSDRFDYVN